MALRTISICAGVGMHDTGLRAAFDSRTICYVEREAYSAAQLAALIEAQCLDEAPIWSDLATFDGRPWRGAVDCIVAGLPCQPYSPAGKQKGNADHRAIGDGNGPIVHFLRVVSESEPAVVFLENVPAWVTRGWFRPFGEELCRMGYEIKDPIFLAASDVGATHGRGRVWLMAIRPSRGLGILRESLRSYRLTDRSSEQMADTKRLIVSDEAAVRPSRTIRTATPSAGRAVEHATGKGLERCEIASFQQTESRPERRGTALANTNGDIGRGCDRQSGQRDAPIGGEMADTIGTGREGHEQRKTRNGDRPRPEAYGSTAELCGLFAPGPFSPRWSGVVTDYPHLAPATEPGIRGMADGFAWVVDESRRHQLRALGNGGVPLCAAVAFSELARRAIEE